MEGIQKQQTLIKSKKTNNKCIKILVKSLSTSGNLIFRCPFSHFVH